MTIDKGFKKLVRARMEKTGESYTAALAHLQREEDDPDAIYRLAVDGRWSARSRTRPGDIGYGPTKTRAEREMFNRRFDELSKTRPPNLLTLVESKDGKWTARATAKLGLVGEGTSEETAIRDWRAKMGRDPEHAGARKYTRMVFLKEHEDGRWSATSDRHDHQIGWGEDKNEAEENLLDAEYDYDCTHDTYDDFGYYRDD